MYLSYPKAGHTTGASDRSARWSGRAGSGKIGCQHKYSPRKHKSTVPSKKSKKRCFNVSPEARTSEILCEPTEESNQRLTSSLSEVYQRFITGTRSVLCSWLPNNGTTFFCRCKTFSCKACPGKIAQNTLFVCSVLISGPTPMCLHIFFMSGLFGNKNKQGRLDSLVF